MRTGMELRAAKSLVWGVVLIAIGAIVLLRRFGGLDLPRAGKLWPVMFLAFGAIHFFARQPGSAVAMLLVGTWLFACQFRWFDLTYGNSWPLLLVAAGGGIVVGAFAGRPARAPVEGGRS